jgi:hypothetical protein
LSVLLRAFRAAAHKSIRRLVVAIFIARRSMYRNSTGPEGDVFRKQHTDERNEARTNMTADTAARRPASLSSDVRSAIKTALRLNEIGNASPYQLSFAGKGRSGASFGFMQGDMAAGPQIVRDTFAQAMLTAEIAGATVTALARQLSVPLFHNPLSPADTRQVNAALATVAGRRLVDTMDDELCAGVLRSVATCVDRAAAANRTVDPAAEIYMALWINMTGPPSTLLDWLSGRSVFLGRELAPPGPIVDGAAMEQYLRATTYFIENPGNLPHTLQSAEAGINQLTA